MGVLPNRKSESSVPGNMWLRGRLLLAVGLIAIAPLPASADKGTEFKVSNADEIKAVLQQLTPGDTVVMTNGTWTDQHIEFAAKGVKESPITLRPQTPGLVVLNGSSTLKVSGAWLVVDGLRFDGGALKSGSIVQFRGSLGHAENSRLTNSSIVNFNPPNVETRYFWVSLYGRSNRVDNCYFHNQTHSGVTVAIWRDTPDSDQHAIVGNHFADRPVGTGNGFETIRIGTSDESESDSLSIVENNLFERMDGEMEIISNKSGGNVFRSNTFSECAGTLTLRHGHGNVVDGNFFLGRGKRRTGGVRVIGENQIVVNNYFSQLDGRSDGAIAITAGVPNSPLNGYSQVKNVVIAHNTIVDVKDAAIVFSQGYGSSKRTLLADGVTIANNAIFSDQDPLFEGKQGTGWKWQGNVAFGQSLGTAKGNPGIQAVAPRLQPDANAIWRPQSDSPLIDAAIGDFSKITTVDMDGQKRVGVFDIGADELSTRKATRRALAGTDVGPPLVIVLSEATIDESHDKQTTTATVIRNKNLSAALTVTITNSDPGNLQAPSTVTIPARQSSVNFTITAIDDQTVDGTQTVTLNATAADHPAGSVTVLVKDHD